VAVNNNTFRCNGVGRISLVVVLLHGTELVAFGIGDDHALRIFMAFPRVTTTQ